LLFGVGLAVPWGAGALVRLRAGALARQRNQLVAQAVEQERRALMRELHDVAGHALAVAAMQAGVALVALDSDPDQARKSMDAVQLASSRALGELRSLLRSVAGPVRPPATEPIQPYATEPARSQGEPTRPQAEPSRAQGEPTRSQGEPTRPQGEPTRPQGYGFAELHELVDNVRSAGLSVELRLSPPGEELDPELSRVVYRIVQESLTNVIRHAGTGRAWVTVGPTHDGLRVRIVDHGNGPRQTAPGLGLAGMQERVRAAGGWLHAGPGPRGGFLVEALLPLESVRQPSLAGR
jgi:signal transduction histidine kinase